MSLLFRFIAIGGLVTIGAAIVYGATQSFANRKREQEVGEIARAALEAPLAPPAALLPVLPERILDLHRAERPPTEFETILTSWERTNPNHAEAARKIHYCYTHRSTALSLSGLNLYSLPPCLRELTALKYLDLSDNQLTAPPDLTGLTALKYLDLSDNQLTAPPDLTGLTALQILGLSRNQLTVPPTLSGLTALQILDLSRNQLTAPPDLTGLTALQILDLSRNQLTVPPTLSGLTALKSLDLSDNRLTALDPSILSLPRQCLVELSNTGLSATVLTRLQEDLAALPEGQGPRISHSMLAPEADPLPLALRGRLSFLYQAAGQPFSELPILVAADEESGHLNRFLSRLQDTATYRKGGTDRQLLLQKVIGYLQRAEEDEDFRGLLMQILAGASETCGDRVALALLHIDIQYRLRTVPPEPRALADFLTRGVYAMSLLEEYAGQIVPSLRFFDEIEVYLGLPIRLQERLGLPLPVEDMLFFACSSLTPEHLNRAEEYVRERIDNPATVHQFLIRQDRWLALLQLQSPKEFAAIQEARESASSADNPDYMTIQQIYEAALKALTARALSTEPAPAGALPERPDESLPF